MNMPKRIQRRRVRGWRKPTNTVCVTRGTLWGNPFIVKPDVEPGTKVGAYFAVPSAADAVAAFKDYMLAAPDLIEKAKRNLHGKDLACWCDLGEPCHADVLLEFANAPICEEACP